MKQGPNVKRLIVHKMSLLMIPPGTPEGAAFATGMTALAKPGNIGVVAKQAAQWVEAAINAVRSASEPNPRREADDEEIAGEILRGIETRKAARESVR